MQVSYMTPAWINYPDSPKKPMSFAGKVGRLADQYFSFSAKEHKYTKTTNTPLPRWELLEVKASSVSGSLKYVKYASYILIILPIIAAVVKYVYKADLEQQLNHRIKASVAARCLDKIIFEKTLEKTVNTTDKEPISYKTVVKILVGNFSYQTTTISIEAGKGISKELSNPKKTTKETPAKSIPLDYPELFIVKDKQIQAKDTGFIVDYKKRGDLTADYEKKLTAAYIEALNQAAKKSNGKPISLAIKNHSIPHKDVPEVIIDAIHKFCWENPSAFSEIRIVLTETESSEGYVNTLQQY